MEKNKDNFSPEEIQKIAKSDAARQLMALLGQDNAASLRQKLRQGETDQVQRLFGQFLSDPQVKALVQQLEEQSRG